MRHALTKIAAAVLLLAAPVAACADPISLIAAGVGAGFTGTAALVVGAITTYGGYALLALNIYGGIDARRRAKNAQRDATRAYNASVTDRSVTVLQGTPPWRLVYGECITGGSVVAMFTSNKTTVSSTGSATTKADGLKHLVILMASHEVEALGDLFVDGVALGALDGSGFATGSDWTAGAAAASRTVTRVLTTGTTTLTVPATSIVSAVSLGDNYNTFDVDRTVAISGGGLTLTITDGLGAGPVTVVYRTAPSSPSVIRVTKHLGAPGQTVDTYLNSVKPTEWDSTHTLNGCAYLVVTLDLEDSRFQGGPPNLTCRVKGKKLYDPRLDTTNGGTGSHRYADPSTWEWSGNPALCVRDWITGEYGMASAHGDVIDAFTAAAANACDVGITTDIGGVTASDVSYRCNGVATTEDGREAVLDRLADSMAGFAIYSAQWQILAGAWTAPVMGLTDDDLDGQIEVVQAGAGIDELFNGVRGTYIGEDSASPTDFEPYQNSTFVTADGEALWQDVALPFTNSKPHCANIARVLVERGRNSQVIQYPAKLRAWPLQIGDRVTVTSAEYGITTPKPYRVTDWQFGLSAPVTLVLQEDAEAAYDTVDAVDADPTPNTNMPSPWVVEAISLNTPESGTNHLVQFGDGTIGARVWVSWAALTGAYLRDGQGRVVVRWRRVGPDVEWQQAMASADDDGIYLLGMVDGDRVVIEAWAMNALGFRGDSDWKAHTVVGKAAAPANVSGLSATAQPGGVLLAWTANTELDHAETELRHGASWAAGTTIYKGRGSNVVWAWPAAGSYTVWAKHRDSSGNESATASSVALTVGAANLISTASVDADAITKVHTVTASGVAITGEKGVPTGTFTTVASLTFTPPVSCEVLISVDGSVVVTTPASGSLADYAMFSSRVLVNGSQVGPLRTYAIDLKIGFSQAASATISRALSFPATGGVAYTVTLQGQQYVVATTCTVEDLRMRLEEIRR